MVRVNPVATADHALDVEAVKATDYTTVMLAKTETAEQVASLAPLDVVVLVETPRGALAVTETARVDNAVAVMWGAEDLFAATGGTANRRPDGSYRDVAKHVRSQTLLAAKAFGRLALDSVYLDIKDLDGLRAETDDAVAVGFDAKVAIHPTQVAVIRAGTHPPLLRPIGRELSSPGPPPSAGCSSSKVRWSTCRCCAAPSASWRWRRSSLALGGSQSGGELR